MGLSLKNGINLRIFNYRQWSSKSIEKNFLQKRIIEKKNTVEVLEGGKNPDLNNGERIIVSGEKSQQIITVFYLDI